MHGLNHKFRFFSLLLLMLCLITGCSASPEQVKEPRPSRAPANNEKPDLIAADSPYADVPVYDKFGAWPSKQGDTYYSSDVGTWYTLWWHAEGGAYYDRWYLENWTRLKPVDYGYYASGDEDYLTSVLVRMKYIGIDFLVLDDTNGGQADITSNLYKCYKTADNLNGFSPKIAIATGGDIRDHNNAEAQQAAFNRYYSVYTRYPDVFYEYDGKPLLLMYMGANVDVRMDDAKQRFTMRYGTGFVSWQNWEGDASKRTIFKTQGNWGWVFDMQNPGTEIMGVQPGYNKAHQGTYTTSFPRDNGVRYTQMWLDAIKANPRVIMIPSYNDHAEETGWEATTPIRPAIDFAAQDVKGEDPYVYEKITEAYLALRYGYIEGFFYKVENTTQIYQCVNGYLEKVKDSKVGKEPVILLPEGYMEWELARNRE